MHGKHVLLTKGATIPHITLNVDAQFAAQICLLPHHQRISIPKWTLQPAL